MENPYKYRNRSTERSTNRNTERNTERSTKRSCHVAASRTLSFAIERDVQHLQTPANCVFRQPRLPSASRGRAHSQSEQDTQVYQGALGPVHERRSVIMAVFHCCFAWPRSKLPVSLHSFLYRCSACNSPAGARVLVRVSI